MAKPKTGFDSSKLGVGAGIIASTFVPPQAEILEPPTPAVPISWTALFATKGGVTATVIPQIRYVECDGLMMNTKEALRNDGYEVKIATTVLNADISSLNKALAGSLVAGGKLSVLNDIDTSVSSTQFNTFYFITWLGDGKIGVHTISNALATNGLNYKTNDKGETEISVEFTGHYAVATQDAVPYAYEEYSIT